MKEVISILVAIMSALLTFYLANRLTLNDSMDSKSGWRKELMDIASKDEITLADIYRIRASVRYYPHLKPTQLSFRWMTNLIIKLCDEYLVEAYRNKKADNTNNMQNVKKVQLTKSKNKCFSRQIILGKFKFNKSKRLSSTCSTNYGASQNNLTSVIALPETDEIVRIICRYLLKYHWEARQKMRIFRRGRDLMNIDDDKPSEDAARTIQLILEQVKEMDNNNQDTNNTQALEKQLEKAFEEGKKCESSIKIFRTLIWLNFAILSLPIAYKVFALYVLKFQKIEGVTEFIFWEGTILEVIAGLSLIVTVAVFTTIYIVKSKCWYN